MRKQSTKEDGGCPSRAAAHFLALTECSPAEQLSKLHAVDRSKPGTSGNGQGAATVSRSKAALQQGAVVVHTCRKRRLALGRCTPTIMGMRAAAYFRERIPSASTQTEGN